MKAPAAELRDVTFGYGGRDAEPVLEDVSLVVQPRDFVGLIGPNGGGKTTLLRLMLGLLVPQRGTVRMLGRRPREVSPRIGYVPQTAGMDTRFPATVLDVVLAGRLGLSRWGVRYGRVHVAAARESLARVGASDLADRAIGELSGGQRQRVLIARALAADARLLLLDEPLAGIDLHMEEGVLDTLHELNRELPIVLVSHDLGFVSRHVRRVACLNRRLAVHRPEEITPGVIAEMYRTQGAVRRIAHEPHCPAEDESAKGDRP